MSRPLMRPVTATMRLRSSRVICGWPVIAVTWATRLSGKRWPSGARRRRSSRSRTVWRLLRGRPDAHAHHLRASLHLGGDHAAQVVGQHVGDLLGVDAFQGGLVPVHPDVQGVAGQDDAVVDVHDAGDLADGLGHLGGQVLQQLPSSSEKILISMGWGTAVRSPIRSSISWASSIASPGTVLLDVAAHVVHHGLDVAPREGLQADEEVALVGLGEAQPPSCRPVRRE